VAIETERVFADRVAHSVEYSRFRFFFAAVRKATYVDLTSRNRCSRHALHRRAAT
jgi:hypothetical protein